MLRHRAKEAQASSIIAVFALFIFFAILDYGFSTANTAIVNQDNQYANGGLATAVFQIMSNVIFLLPAIVLIAGLVYVGRHSD